MAKAGMPVFRYDWGLASHCMCMPGGRDCPGRGVLAKMMVDKVAYTKRQPNTGQGGATEHARIVFSCSNRTQSKPTSPHSSDVVGARWTGVGGGSAQNSGHVCSLVTRHRRRAQLQCSWHAVDKPGMQEGLLKLGFCAELSDFCSGTIETASRNDQGSAQNSAFQPRLQPRDTSPASRVTPVFLACCGQTRHAGGPSQARLLRCAVRFLQRHDRDCVTKRSRRCSVSNGRQQRLLMRHRRRA